MAEKHILKCTTICSPPPIRHTQFRHRTYLIPKTIFILLTLLASYAIFAQTLTIPAGTTFTAYETVDITVTAEDGTYGIIANGTATFNTTKTNINVTSTETGAARGIVLDSNRSINFNSGEVYINVNSKKGAYGIAISGVGNPFIDVPKGAVTVTADKFVINVDGGLNGVSAINNTIGIVDIRAKELEITATTGGLPYTVTASLGGIIKLNSESTKITANSTYTYGDPDYPPIYGGLPTESQVDSMDLALHVQQGGLIFVNANSDGSIYNENYIVQINGDIVSSSYNNIDANYISTIHANFTHPNSYLRGNLWEQPGNGSSNLVPDTQWGIIDILFSNEATWAPTTKTKLNNRAHATFDNANIDLAWWSADQISQGLATSNMLRTIKLNSATIIGDSVLIINSDVANDKADCFIVDTLEAGSNANIIQQIKVAYDPAIQDYIDNGETGAKLYAASSLIPVMIINNDNGKAVTGESVATYYTALQTFEITANIVTQDINNGDGTGIYIDYIEINNSEDPGPKEDTILMLKWMSRTMNDNLMRRMGDLRLDPEHNKNGLWARTYMAELDTDSSYAGKYNKQKFYGGQLGVDKKHDKGDDILFTGLFIDYLNVNNRYVTGSGRFDNLGLAAYGTWINDDGHYIDLVAKAAKINGNFKTIDTVRNNEQVTADFDTWAMALSAEYGYKIKAKVNWIIEPQVQLTYSRIGGMNFDLNNNVHVIYGNIDSLIGRIGFTAGREFDEGNLYAGAFYFHDFSDETSIYANAPDGSNLHKIVDTGKNWYRLNIGTNINISTDDCAYFEIARLFGRDIHVNWLLNAGFRFAF